jgi:two-component system, OmpR family, sensor histidine kinase KdpD
VPPADRDTMFVPFQRLGDTEPATGIGLGLAVSRGLTEAMRGTLEPDETPGGGLTMIMSVPAAPGPAPPPGTAWWPASPSPDWRELTDDNDRRYAS